jgi:selT/selW/selH-like putative selenoprotein
VALEDAFPGKVKVIAKKDPGTTGNFEVFLPNGELIHSKSKKGQGKCESEEEREAVIEQVRAFVDSK